MSAPSRGEPLRVVLFRRHFKRLTGGQLKVWHYFNHVRQCPGYTARVYFHPDSIWDETNPWRGERSEVLPAWDPAPADVLFFSGLDWLALEESRRDGSLVPIVNLIQHVKHAQPGTPRHQFLRHKAIRICVGPEVAAAIQETRRVNGPVLVIPNGIDPGELPTPRSAEHRRWDLLIVAGKNPALGERLRAPLEQPGRRVKLLTERCPRPQFLEALNEAHVAVFAPNSVEGFYLPALEAMFLRTLVVCPDCVGNRSFCLDGQNCLRPPYDPRAIIRAADDALRLGPAEMDRVLAAAEGTAAEHSLTREREAFSTLLSHLDDLW